MKSEALDFILSGKISSAIDILMSDSSLTYTHNRTNELINVKSKLAVIESEHRGGRINFEDYLLHMSRVTNAVVAILNESDINNLPQNSGKRNARLEIPISEKMVNKIEEIILIKKDYTIILKKEIEEREYLSIVIEHGQGISPEFLKMVNKILEISI